jgi:hypothetical protein
MRAAGSHYSFKPKKHFMKKILHELLSPSGNQFLISLLMTFVCFTGCRKEPAFHGDNPASQYPADVIDKWMTLEVRIYKNATGLANGAFARPFAYSGISAFEATDPGQASWKNKYNGLASLPQTEIFRKYYWPASVNASLAEFNRSFFTSTNVNATDLAAIDSLENAIESSFSSADPDVLTRSQSFGKSIADAVFAWSKTDGFAQNNALPYTLPMGPGIWIPTPTAFAPPSGPFWENNRPIIAGSGDNSQPVPPVSYSEDKNSAFYKMVNDVYKASKVLTTDQKNWALFWRDVPGVTTPGHWMNITRQVIHQTHSPLDKAAMAYAMVGICLNDAIMSVWETKYKYILIRPVSYIRKVIGDTAWLPAIPTPAHPEYASAHAVISASASEALFFIYGNIGPFMDHTYDYLGFPARTFNSFRDIGVDAGNSRFYGGIHYQPTVDAGIKQGRIVGGNIVTTLRQSSDPVKKSY